MLRKKTIVLSSSMFNALPAPRRPCFLVLRRPSQPFLQKRTVCLDMPQFHFSVFHTPSVTHVFCLLWDIHSLVSSPPNTPHIPRIPLLVYLEEKNWISWQRSYCVNFSTMSDCVCSPLTVFGVLQLTSNTISCQGFITKIMLKGFAVALASAGISCLLLARPSVLL